MKIGIDLGTTNSAMAYTTEDGDTEMIQNAESRETTPSVVLIEEDESVTVGQPAVSQRILQPDRVLTRMKQEIDAADGDTHEIDGREYDAIDAASYILGKLKSDAKDNLGEEVTSAVITVPYGFGDKGRKATKDAAKIVNLEVEEIINEPTAACLSYINDNELEGTVLVYDFGGGTFDATLVESGANINVISTEGDRQLGGEEVDDALYEYVREQLIEDGYPDPEDNIQKKDSLRKDVKEAKHQLSHRPEQTFGFDTGDGMARVEITREEFNEVVEDLVDRTISSIEALFEKETVKDEGISIEDLDHVLMVGGSTRIPLVREKVEDFVGQELNFDTDPDTVVARGAALQAAYYDDRVPLEVLPDATIQDVLSHSLGVETDEDVFDQIFDEDTAVPVENTKPYQNPVSDVANIRVHAMQKGEQGEPADEAESLGDFVLEDVPGDARIDVTFKAEQDGTLHVKADPEGTEGGEITIEDEIGLTGEGVGDRQNPEKGVSPVEEFGLEPQASEGDD